MVTGMDEARHHLARELRKALPGEEHAAVPV
jgi:hypothetical protein